MRESAGRSFGSIYDDLLLLRCVHGWFGVRWGSVRLGASLGDNLYRMGAEMKWIVLSLCLAGCSPKTVLPRDIAAAEEACSKNGGWFEILPGAFLARGHSVRCIDGSYVWDLPRMHPK